MKRIYRMVLGSYVGPLVLTFFIAVFILLMQFLWLYIDILIGKGLEWKVIAELFFYASWTTVPMALPLSILLSSLMTFGNLGEHYELVAVKSAGISFWKTMRPLIILSVFISIFAFLFSNNALPYAELKRKSLVYDIQHKKLSFNIKAGEFYHDIDGYVIRVGRKDSKDEKILYDVLIYDHTDRSGGTKMTVARKGIMEMSPDGNNLVLELEDGWNYEESGTGRKESNQQTRPMQRIRYENQIMHFDISGFEMSRTDEELFKSNYNMLNLDQLNYAIDSLRTRIELRKDDFVASYTNSYTILKQPEILAADSVENASDTAYAIVAQKPLDSLSDHDKKTVIAAALNMTRNQKQSIEFFMTDLKNQETLLRKHEAVRHEKFTLSFACLVLFFIGAPLGSIIRKGGLGFPMIIATFLFIMFHIINMIGKKYAIADAIPVWFGTWLSAIILFPFGLFLTLKASNDSPIFDLDSWKKIVYRFISKKGRKMKILLLCNKSPFPPKEGGPMAMHAILMGLLDAGNEVKVLTFSTNKFPASEIPKELSESFETVDINLNINPFKAFKNLFSQRSLHVARFMKKEMTQKIDAILSKETFDIVQIESLFMTAYIGLIRKKSDAKIILRAHNVESLIWERIVRHYRNPLKRTYIKLLGKRLRKYELKMLHQVDGIATISQVDLEHFRQYNTTTPMIAIPFSINTKKFQYETYGTPEPFSFFHIGSMDWMPNQEGIRWFLEFVWPDIHRKNPQTTFYLAGRNMPEWLKKFRQPGVVIVGEVPDSQEFIRSKAILTVPLLSGSGIRIKIIEGMACMRTILTTGIGAEGIEYSDGINILIADNHNDFVEKAQKIIDNQLLCEKIGMAAHQLIMEKYDTKKIIADLTDFYQLCIEK